jgi:hypothetical protein
MAAKIETAKTDTGEPSSDRRGRMRPIAAELMPLIGKPMGRRGFAEGGLIAHWPAVVGEEIARATAPLKISFPRGERREGTLTLRVAGAHATEIQHLVPQILERINGYLGYGAIARLKLEQGRLPKPRPPAMRETGPLRPEEQAALDAAVTRIGDPELRRALDALGRAVKGLRRPPNPAK